MCVEEYFDLFSLSDSCLVEEEREIPADDPLLSVLVLVRSLASLL